MACPSVTRIEPVDLTPEHLRCAYAAACQSVTAVAGDLLIVGKRGDQIAKDLGKGVGPDEYPITISPDYLSVWRIGCQASEVAKGDGSAPQAAFQASDSAEAYFGVHGKMLRNRATEHPESPLSRDLLIAAGWIDALNCQLQEAQRQIEEAGLPADERTAATADASLTPKSSPELTGEPHSRGTTSEAIVDGQGG
jgi:hypothetical protein